MNQDRLAGAAETLAGRATTATGELFGSDTLIARGDAQQVLGRLRNIAGSIRDFFGLRSKMPERTSQSSHVRPTPYTSKGIEMNEDEILGNVRSVKGKIEKAAGDITTDTKWQADGVIDQVAGGAQNLYGRAKDKVQDVLDDAPDALADAGERVRDVAHRGRRLANDQVTDNPWSLVAVAGIVGYALAWALHGRRD